MILLKLIIITSLFCNGLHKSAESGYSMDWFHEWTYNKLPLWLHKPLIGCIYCMSSIYSVLAVAIYFYLYQFDINLVYLLPVMICCVSALNGIIYSWIND